MAKGSQYPSMTNLTGAERLLGIQGTATEKVTLDDISAFAAVQAGAVTLPLLASDQGSGLIGYSDGRTTEAVIGGALANGESIFSFAPPVGNDVTASFAAAISAVQSGGVPSRTLVLPEGDWTVSATVLFPLSNFTLVLLGNVALTSTTRQHTLLFAYESINGQPSQSLENVRLIGNGSVVDGNGAAMTFSYAHGDGSETHSAVRFNYVKDPYVEGIHATNGPIDSLSFRQCKRPYAFRCTFTASKEDNGASITTDWNPSGWAYGDLDTYSLGKFEECVAYGNEDFGMTAFNASGVEFIACKAWGNKEGFSYEDAYATPNVKTYDGKFVGCSAFDNTNRGFYIDADGVTVDDNCVSSGHRGFVGDNSTLIQNNGVVISNVNRAYVGGDHSDNGACGLAMFNGATQAMKITIGGKFRNNDGPGIYGRGVDARVRSGTLVDGNGRVLVNGAYSPGIHINNSGGATYLENVGDFLVSGVEVSNSGAEAIWCNELRNARIEANGVNNRASSAGAALRMENTTSAYAMFCNFRSSNGNQTFAVNIANTCANGYEFGCTGDGSTGVVANLATNPRSLRSQYFGSATWDPPSIASGSAEATTFTVTGAEVGDPVQVTFSADTGALVPLARVSSTNNVTVTLRNFTGSAIDPGSMTVRALVTRRNGG